MKYVNPAEAIKRLAAAQGIDVLNLIKTKQEMEAEQSAMVQQQQAQTLLNQAGQLAKAPLADPEKNPEGIQNAVSAMQAGLAGARANQTPPSE